MSFFENTRKPVGFGGKIMVAMMNLGHSAVARWGLQFLNTAPDAKVLDCGCGGGANIRRLLKKCPQGVVKGIDYSPVSVEKTKKVNETAIADGRCAVLQGSVADMMFADNWFDAVTAFETVYFWPDLPRCFREVWRVLKPGGQLLNFDANWYNYLYDADLKQQYEQDRRNVQQNDLEDHYLSTDIDAMEAIAMQVPLTGIQRPHWDIRTLEKLRMRSITTDVSVWQRVWSTVEKINYASTPMFMIAAIK